jgi:1,2-diacylglycerol 3-alpha-glucosyltransferase
MNILVMTNTYKPVIGGLERSIEFFAQEFRRRGHRVIIVAPQYPGMRQEKDVVRIPAIENFNGTDFSLMLPLPGVLEEALGEFSPDIVHSQHPFLVGDVALRVASKYNVPLVFTHHTLYEENVHYMPGNAAALKRFIIELATGYAKLADCVFAPSVSIRQLIMERGVQTPIHVVPTGLYVKNFSRGAGKTLRRRLNIPMDAFVVGHIGRLSPEKNLGFLSHAVAAFMKKCPQAHFLVGGQGPSEETIVDIFVQEDLIDRLHMAGVFKGKELADAYHAMDVFAFASQSETQGLVLNESMAAGVPVVAVDASGVREIVQDRINGSLVATENIEDFVSALEWLKKRSKAELEKIKTACHQSAEDFSMDKCAGKALEVYSSLRSQGFLRKSIEQSYWQSKMRLMQAQWALVMNLTKAAGAMIGLRAR